MGEILFLAHRIPFLPDRGDKIRSHHIVRALAGFAPVHVGCFAENETDRSHESRLAGVAATYHLADRLQNLPLSGLQALASHKPVSLMAFYDRGLEEWVRERLETRDISTIFVFSGQMGQYVPHDYRGRVIVDLCDVDSAKFEAYAENSVPPLRWLHAREAGLLAVEERRLARRADHTLLVSDAEAALFRDRLGSAEGISIAAIRNGIDTAFFDPQAVGPQPDMAAMPGPHLVFTGQMDYPPNIAAMKRAIHDLLPAIRRKHHVARLHVVGRAAGPELMQYDGKDGVRVWGEVPDIRPFLAAADIVLAPLTIARGVQNKVLEAMAMARPVVLSAEAATGIAGVDGEHFVIGDDDDRMLAGMEALLGDGGEALAMGAAARRFVCEEQGWDAMLARLPELCGFATDGVSRDAA